VACLLHMTNAPWLRVSSRGLDSFCTHSAYPESEVHLAVHILTLRAARDGTGKITGQKSGRLASRGCRAWVLERLVADDWLRLTGTVTEAPSRAPRSPSPRCCPVGPARSPSARTSAQGSPAGRESRGRPEDPQEKPGATTRLLALYTIAHARPDGRLGRAEDCGLPLGKAAASCALSPGEVTEHSELLITADWLGPTSTPREESCADSSPNAFCMGPRDCLA